MLYFIKKGCRYIMSSKWAGCTVWFVCETFPVGPETLSEIALLNSSSSCISPAIHTIACLPPFAVHPYYAVITSLWPWNMSRHKSRLFLNSVYRSFSVLMGEELLPGWRIVPQWIDAHACSTCTEVTVSTSLSPFHFWFFVIKCREVKILMHWMLQPCNEISP